MISNMAGVIGMKLSGVVVDRGQSNLAKECFERGGLSPSHLRWPISDSLGGPNLSH